MLQLQRFRAWSKNLKVMLGEDQALKLLYNLQKKIDEGRTSWHAIFIDRHFSFILQCATYKLYLSEDDGCRRVRRGASTHI